MLEIIENIHVLSNIFVLCFDIEYKFDIEHALDEKFSYPKIRKLETSMSEKFIFFGSIKSQLSK